MDIHHSEEGGGEVMDNGRGREGSVEIKHEMGGNDCLASEGGREGPPSLSPIFGCRPSSSLCACVWCGSIDIDGVSLGRGLK